MRCRKACLKLFVGLGLLLVASAASAADDSLSGDVLVTGLQRPVSITVQPSTADVFIAESGAGRIVRCKLGFAESSRPQNIKPEPVIAGFGSATESRSGLVAIDFLNRDLLVVLTSRKEEHAIRTYELPAGEGPLDAAKTKHQVLVSDAQSIFGLAATPSSLFVTSGPGAAPGAVYKSDLLDGAEPLQSSVFVDADSLHGASTPAGVTISPRGELVLVCSGKQAGTEPSVVFLNALSGNLLMNLPTGGRDLIAVTYSPKTGRLYALDSSPSKDGGGLYRLDAAIVNNRPSVKVVKLADLDGPTALAFWPDGTLYVTTVGKSDAAAAGQLLRFAGL